MMIWTLFLNNKYNMIAIMLLLLLSVYHSTGAELTSENVTTTPDIIPHICGEVVSCGG